MLISAPFPEANDARADAVVEKRFGILQEIIRNVRGLRTECGIDPAAKIHLALLIENIEYGKDASVCREKSDIIMLLAGIKEIEFVTEKPAHAIGTVAKGCEAFLVVDESINKEQLLARFQKEAESSRIIAQKAAAKLAGNFAKHAAAELVAAEREKLADNLRRAEKLEAYIKDLS